MRSLLFVPADSGSKLDKALASGADAVIVDLEDSIAPDRKAAARASAAALPQERGSRTAQAPSPPGARQRPRRPASPMPTSTRSCRRGPTPSCCRRRKAAPPSSTPTPSSPPAKRSPALPDGHIKIVAMATETAAALFLAGTYRGASARLDRPDLGRGGPFGRARRRGQSRRRRAAFRRPIGWRARSAWPARRPRGCRRSTPSRWISATSRAAPRDRGGAPRRLHRQDGDPSGAGSGHQRGVHADRRGDRQGARGRRGLRRQPGHGDVGIDGMMYDRPHLDARASCSHGRTPRGSYLTATTCCRRPPSDRTACRRRGIPTSRHQPRRAAPRDRSTSAGRCGRRRGRPARP